MGVDSTSVLGNIKSAVEAITGYDLITGEKLGFWDRAIAGATAIIPGGGVLKAGLAAGIAAGTALKLAKKADDIKVWKPKPDRRVKCFGINRRIVQFPNMLITPQVNELIKG
ncbi:hypothetical protein CBW65_02575 [Tumebacillus avium]|uniref:Pre-toxin TG domain-containing protein n=1 Tax=Tumebacillus avium TaxID=1903704 RepID=A0A1Y0IKV2_9BACL|nr:pre-toxin TG domain-containing protein [Tumebacillus avium]ARU60073.1 hypothetical protein CBW65_02575 [Tumebacillus avium]